MAFKDRPIKRKLTTLFLLTSGVAVLLTCAAYLAAEFMTFRQTTIEQISTIGEVVAANSTAAMAFSNQRDADNVLASLKTQQHIVAAALYDRDGALFSKYPPDLPADALPAAPEPDGQRLDRSHVFSFQAVAQGRRRLGTIYIKSDLEVLYSQLRLDVGIMGVVGVTSLMVAFVVSAVLQRQISEPILALASTAHAIASRRDYSVRATRSANDELGVLTDAFNQMLTRIDEQDRELRESDERHQQLAAIIESAADPILSQDLDGTIRSWNAGATRLFGYRADEIIGRPVTQLIPEDLLDEENRLGQLLVDGQQVQPFDSMRRRKDGTLVPVSLQISPIKDMSGHTIGASNIVRDITELKRIEAQLRTLVVDLERSNLALEQFASVASHDLQEPLRMVSSYTQLLEHDYGPQLDDDAREYISYAVDGAKRMQRLINDLLDFSRVGTRGQPLEPVDANVVLGAVRANLTVAIADADAVVSNEELPTVMADATQLGQLLQNLIANAIKFRGTQSPQVSIRACERRDEWVFSVRDNGIGIEPQYADRIFTIFQRLHVAAEYPGTGIGLAVCKRIAERHRGRIWVESELGNGATFFFSIAKPVGG